MNCTTDTCDCAAPAATTTATPERVSYRRPSYDVRETAEAYDIEVLVPGSTREGVEVELDDDVLTLTARRAAAAPEAWRPLHREIPAEDFRLALRLNVDVDAAKIEATVADGVLRVRLPKAEATKPRRIAVT